MEGHAPLTPRSARSFPTGDKRPSYFPLINALGRPGGVGGGSSLMLVFGLDGGRDVRGPLGGEGGSAAEVVGTCSNSPLSSSSRLGPRRLVRLDQGRRVGHPPVQRDAAAAPPPAGV